MSALSSERWREVEEAFDRVTNLENAAERSAFLDNLGRRDPDLRSEVEALLSAESKAPAFLDAGAAEFAGPALEMASEELDETTAGDRLGVYRLVREIGRGGMSRVYLAERAAGDFEQRVAIKILAGSTLATSDGARRFRTEQRILAALEHPAIARLLDGGTTEGGRPYLVMEYVDGLPVTDFCRSRDLGLDERLRLVLAICTAVDFAHQHLVVHRDLKPNNILVDERGEVRLLDFGIAKLLDPASHPDLGVSVPLTRTGLYLMTPEYAAPEQIRGAPITTATDVYALGLLLYELLTGRLPYELERKTPVEIEKSICDLDPPPPSTAVGDQRPPAPPTRWAGRLEGDLDTIVLKALRKEPEERYTSVRELALDLERFLSGRPISARPATLRYRARKFVRRNPVGVAITALALAALAVFSGVMAWQRDVARRAERETSAINTFLVEGLLGSAAPEIAQGQDVSVLDAAARRIDGSFDGQPALEASVRRTLGRLYLSHGELEAAAHQLERADTLSRASFGPAHRDTLDGRRLLAELEIERGDFAAARQLLGELLRRQSEALGEQDLDVFETQKVLARAELADGDYARAEERLLAALATPAARKDRAIETRLGLESTLADVYVAQRRWPEVEQVAGEVLDLQRRHLGPNHPDVADTLTALGRAQSRNKHFSEALMSLEEALELRRRILGDDHPDTLRSISELTRYYRDIANFDSAERYAELELELSRQSLGPDHPRTLRALEVVGFIHRRAGHADVALPIYRKAADRHAEVLGPGHPSAIRSRKNLNRYLFSLGRIDEARIEGAKAIQASFDRLAEGERDATLLNDLAWYLVTCDPPDLRQPERALPLAVEAVEKTDHEWASGIDTLARVHYELGDLDAAIAAQREVVALPESVAFMDNERRLIEYLEEEGDLEAVETELRANLERRLAAGFIDHPIRGVSHRRLGVNLAKRGLLDQAEEELRTAIGIFARAGETADFQLWRARSELGEVLTRKARYDEAEELLATAAEALAGRTWFEDTTTQHRAQERLAELRAARAASR